MNILVIDDNLFDHELVEEQIECHIPNSIIEKAYNGVEGLKVLEKLYLDKQLPSLIITDLNMPLMDGLEVYTTIKNDRRFNNIPVVIFTTSSFSKARFAEQNIPIFVKPFDIIEFAKVLVDIP